MAPPVGFDTVEDGSRALLPSFLTMLPIRSVRKGDMLFSIDPKAVYFQVLFHPDSHLTFRSEFSSSRRFASVFSQLPRSSPGCHWCQNVLTEEGFSFFNTVSRQLVGYCGFIPMYVGKLRAPSQSLQRPGLRIVIRWEKSELDPTSKAFCLGMLIDTI